MAEDNRKLGRKQGLKSRAGNKPLRSLGFLSQPGSQVKAAPSGRGESEDQREHHRSRGSRPVSVTSDGKPRTLPVKAPVKPYTLEDK
ncbi:hypothetical protein [Roseibium marinum]|uniref:Uncharacterized protein n=1 Tax=Roseibium marinum TaxID=281252 RepID=A0A2S3V3T7_9HYPH|nr:hypothetical protein [Roseibium marinum]POF34329.1 hypothetical protein CLV41_101783 [Roseibium marinum]